MAQFKNVRKVELSNGTAPVVNLGQIYYGDVEANRIGAIVFLDGAPVALTGTCSGTAILADGSTVPLTGALEGNMAYVDLTSSCYSKEGQIRVFVKLTVSDVTTTLIAAVGTVRLTETDTVIDPGTIIPSVSALIADIDEAVASIPADYSALLATIAPNYSSLTFPVKAGQWCWYSGVLYEAIQDISTSENWTAAHWTTVTVGGEVTSLKSAITQFREDVGEYLALSIADFTSGKYYAKGDQGDAVSATDNAASVYLATPINLENYKGGKIRIYKNYSAPASSRAFGFITSNNKWDVCYTEATAPFENMENGLYKLELKIPDYQVYFVASFINSNTIVNIEFESLDVKKNDVEYIESYIGVNTPESIFTDDYYISPSNRITELNKRNSLKGIKSIHISPISNFEIALYFNGWNMNWTASAIDYANDNTYKYFYIGAKKTGNEDISASDMETFIENIHVTIVWETMQDEALKNTNTFEGNKINIPSGILFDETFAVHKKENGYEANKTADDYWNYINGHTYYVDGTNGSNSNDGEKSTPLKTIKRAIELASNGDNIIVKSGLYTRSGLDNYSKDLHIIGDGEAYLIGGDSGSELSFSSAGNGVYSATRSNVHAVLDFYTGEPIALDGKNSLADCEAAENSWFLDGSTLYVHCKNDRIPDNKLIAMLSVSNNTLAAQKTLFAENIIFYGGTEALQADEATLLIAKGCIFGYGKQNGLALKGTNAYLYGCTARNNMRDGYNYHKSTNNVICKAVEIGCMGYSNGINDGNGNNNGSTIHDGCMIVRIGGRYWHNDGPNVADVNTGSVSFNIACKCSFSVAESATRQIDYHSDDAEMVLIDCSASDSNISAKITSSGKMYVCGFVYNGTKDVSETGEYEPYLN